MKKIFLLIVITNLIFACTFSYGQAPNWLWANGTGGPGGDISLSSTTDLSNNVYVTGSFSNPYAIFGSTVLTTNGNTDFFLSKYDSNGNLLWVTKAGGTGQDAAISVCTDATGDVYVTGEFYSPTMAFGTTTLTNAGTYDTFIAKYDSNGNVLWAKRVGGPLWDESMKITSDPTGNIYLVGRYQSFSLMFGSTTLTNAGQFDIYFAKYDSNGNVLWAKSFGSSNHEEPWSVHANSIGEVYMTGNYSGSLSIGSYTLNSAGSSDALLAKFDSNGNTLWAKSIGGPGSDGGTDISTDPTGNFFISGTFNSSSLSIGTTSLACAGGVDVFFAKYDAAGNPLWAKSIGGTANEFSYTNCSGTGSNLFLAGQFYSSTLTVESNTLTNAGLSDMFIAKYDGSGNLLWTKSIGGSGAEDCRSITIGPAGDVSVSGFFQSSPLSFGSTTLTSAGSQDIFVAKLANNPLVINEEMTPSKILIYPTTFSEQATLESSKNLNNANLTFFNSIGQIELEIKNISGNTITIPRNNLPEGLYYLQLHENNQLIGTGKLIAIGN